MHDSNLKAMHNPHFHHAEVCVPSIEHATANVHIEFVLNTTTIRSKRIIFFINVSVPLKDI